MDSDALNGSFSSNLDTLDFEPFWKGSTPSKGSYIWYLIAIIFGTFSKIFSLLSLKGSWSLNFLRIVSLKGPDGFSRKFSSLKGSSFLKGSLFWNWVAVDVGRFSKMFSPLKSSFCSLKLSVNSAGSLYLFPPLKKKVMITLSKIFMLFH